MAALSRSYDGAIALGWLEDPSPLSLGGTAKLTVLVGNLPVSVIRFYHVGPS